MVLKKCFAFCPLKGKTKNVLLCAALAAGDKKARL